MEEFEVKYEDLIKRGYEIRFSETNDYNQFTKVHNKIHYASLKKNGRKLFQFPSRISSEKAFLDGYSFLPKIEKLLNKQI
ncbi:MAG: hypothetical protein WBV81_22665 [Ignavibacteriaceae bacterium]